jgi:hypothetical protein
MDDNAKYLLACIKTQDDVTKIQSIGVTEDCFKSFSNYAEVYAYVVGRVKLSMPPTREDIKQLHSLILPNGVHDIMSYANTVVEEYYERATISAIRQYGKDAEKEKGSVSGSIRKLVDNLRSITQKQANQVEVLMGGNDWVDEPDAMEWIIDGILPAKWPTFFYGRGGVAKSYTLLMMASCVATGNPFFGNAINKRRNVLYLDWEMDADAFYYRLGVVGRGLDVGEQRPNPDTGRNQWLIDGLHYYNAVRPLKDCFADVYELIARWDIGLVIIDSFGFSMGDGKEAKESSDTIGAMRVIRSLPCAVAIIDHVSKMKDADGTPFGSVYKLNSCRWAWWLQGESNPDPDDDGTEYPEGTYQFWKNTKHNMGPRHKDVYTLLTWGRTDDGRYILGGEKIEESQMPVSLVKKKKAKDPLSNLSGSSDLVYSTITANGDIASRDELIEKTGYSHTTVDNITLKMQRGGLLHGSIEKYKGNLQAKVYRILRKPEGERLVSAESEVIDIDL